MKPMKEMKHMKYILFLICLSVRVSAAGESDPRIMENRYEPVTSISIFKDIFAAAYDSGNREYIKSMVLMEAIPQTSKDAKKQYSGILPPHFNTRKKVVGITEEKDGVATTTKKHPTAFSHLAEGVEPVAIIKYSYYVLVDGTQYLTSNRFPIVRKDGKLYIGRFSDIVSK
jgi:hypothetical protein